MSGRLTVWHGTEAECVTLMDAMRHAGVTIVEARELLGDQRVIDRLLFVKRTRERWRLDEWNLRPRQEAEP